MYRKMRGQRDMISWKPERCHLKIGGWKEWKLPWMWLKEGFLVNWEAVIPQEFREDSFQKTKENLPMQQKGRKQITDHWLTY